MGTDLRIRRVSLEHADPEHSWRFPDGVTVIVGASGGGKSSLLHLIQYGLGMNEDLVEEITRASSGVILDIDAGARSLQLIRRFTQDRNRVTVGDGNGPARTYQTTRQGTRYPVLGDWLLGQLGIPVVQVAKSRAGRSNELTSISFADVFNYCYLDQDSVDQSTAHSEDPFIGPKRASTFELLYGIIDEVVARLEVERLTLQKTRAERRKEIDTVEKFVQTKGIVGTPQTIEARVAEIDEQEAALTRQLAEARAGAELAVREVSKLPELIAATQRRYSDAREELDTVRQELDGVQRAANQLERDLQAVKEGRDAHSVLDSLPFVTCPRCEQRLDARPHPVGHCVVCLQSDPPPVEDPAADAQAQLVGQLSETQALEARLVSARDSLVAEVAALSSELKAHRAELQRMIAEATAPHLNIAQEVTQQLGALKGERTVLVEARQVAAAVRQEQAEIEQIPGRTGKLEEEEQERRDALSSSRQRVEELSDEFGEILRRLTLPWLESAEVDRSTYLPVVNGRTLKQLSSGGMKTTTNVAYYLANLAMAVRDRQILTPSFMMLDSIRKASGAERDDLARAEHIYSYLRTLHTSRNQPGALRGDFQLIVADNDLPRQFEREFHVMRIDPQHPLIRGL
jgi:hypothetical protein